MSKYKTVKYTLDHRTGIKSNAEYIKLNLLDEREDSINHYKDELSSSILTDISDENLKAKKL